MTADLARKGEISSPADSAISYPNVRRHLAASSRFWNGDAIGDIDDLRQRIAAMAAEMPAREPAKEAVS